MIVVLPWPHKALWPNGGTGHRTAKARQVKSHRAWALAATLSAMAGRKLAVDRVSVRLTIYPQPRGPAPDQDNCMAAAKAYFDGIADALGINDRQFDMLPPLISADRLSRFEIVLGEALANVG